uniref:Ig-like domain-containing protein n=1 Tax=Pundamilia nyererei TaxID=303518 RepID=A0A3B4FGW8_9CICH
LFVYFILCFCFLIFLQCHFSFVFYSIDVNLTCEAPNNNNIIIVEWSRTDLGEEYVLFYRDGHFLPDDQHPSFKNRVDLQDRQMKDGDVSLILKDVTINDTGTYECRICLSESATESQQFLLNSA